MASPPSGRANGELPTDGASRQRKRRRFQFGLSTFFWLALVIAAFFLGRGWDEFVLHVRRYLESGPISVRLRAGESTVISHDTGPITQLDVSDPTVCDVEPIDRHRVRVKARQEGTADLSVWVGDEDEIVSYSVKVKQ
jgi:Flp pilus assembly secretin CpaC